MSKVINVNINDVECSNSENYIIGTSALATCVGFLAYDSKQKKAIVSHFSTNYELTLIETLNKMREENFITTEEYKMCIKIYNFFEEYYIFDYNSSLKNELRKIDVYKIPSRNLEDKVEIIVIDGYYKNSVNVSKRLTDYFEFLNSIFYVNKNKLTIDEVKLEMLTQNEGFTSFYFDATNAQFVTQEVLNNEALRKSVVKKI